MTVLLATDLDRTLVYSRAALALTGAPLPELTCVERRDGEQVGFLTATAARGLAALAGQAVLVPVTTRLPEQLARITLPGPPARFAVAANGGVLLDSGVADRAWQRRVATALAGSGSFAEVVRYVRANCDPAWTLQVREAGGLFCYAVLAPDGAPDGFLAEAADWAAARGWSLSAQGRKLYWMPDGLTKAAAVRGSGEQDRCRAGAGGGGFAAGPGPVAAGRPGHPSHPRRAVRQRLVGTRRAAHRGGRGAGRPADRGVVRRPGGRVRAPGGPGGHGDKLSPTAGAIDLELTPA